VDVDTNEEIIGEPITTYATEEEALDALARSIGVPRLVPGNREGINNPDPEWPDSTGHIGAEEPSGVYRGTVFRNEYVGEDRRTHTYFTYARGDRK
jgi:hypothetical protein